MLYENVTLDSNLNLLVEENKLSMNLEFPFRAKDRISALTHFIGFLLAIIGMPILLIFAANKGCDTWSLVSYGIFSLSMIALYAASTAYHSFELGKSANKVLKKIDHMMIYVLIAGSYTPICINVLAEKIGIRMLVAVWTVAAIGILFNAFWINCPKWVSSIIYIGMGWICVFAFTSIYHNMNLQGFLWLLVGGILYTVGGIIYALKLKILEKINPEFGAHELFHIFVMLGSFCHYIVMFQLF